MTGVETRAGPLVAAFRDAGLRLATVESCTGGLIAASVTAVAGSSAVFDYGFVTYANAAKTDLVGVPRDAIETFGAVSREVAIAMAAGGRLRSGADVAVAVTGIAGPGGGTPAKPVGLVHFALAWSEGHRHRAERFGDIGRDEVRVAAVLVAFEMLEDWLSAQRTGGGAAGP